MCNFINVLKTKHNRSKNEDKAELIITGAKRGDTGTLTLQLKNECGSAEGSLKVTVLGDVKIILSLIFNGN